MHELTIRRRGKVAAVAKLGAAGKGLSHFPYLLFLSQDVHEQILCDHLQGQGVTIERQTELTKLTQDEHGITAEVKTANGAETIKAEFSQYEPGPHFEPQSGQSVEEEKPHTEAPEKTIGRMR